MSNELTRDEIYELTHQLTVNEMERQTYENYKFLKENDLLDEFLYWEIKAIRERLDDKGE